MTGLVTEHFNPTDWDEIGPEIDKVVASLREADRNAIILRFFARKSFAEISNQLQLSENETHIRVERALERICAILGRKGIISSVDTLATILAHKAVIGTPAGLETAAVAAALRHSVETGTVSALRELKVLYTAKIKGWFLAAVARVNPHRPK